MFVADDGEVARKVRMRGDHRVVEGDEARLGSGNVGTDLRIGIVRG